MSAPQIVANIAAFALQIALVTGVGALFALLLRRHEPRLRLVFWQVLLVACLALPWIRGWRQEVVTATARVETEAVAPMATLPIAPARRPLPSTEIALSVLAAGAALRLGWLLLGLFRLSGYRRRGRATQFIPGVSGVDVLLSDDVAGPVTFGWRNPVVLLPESFPAMPAEMRDAILCHELTHVERKDWTFAMAEELVRSVLWFHPCIWWLIAEIQLSREQTVDQMVIEITRARGPYIDALLMMAGAADSGTPRLDLAPAPMFLRRRHLKRRLLEVAGESNMKNLSKIRLACAGCAAAVMLAGVCWLATGAFPLTAAPQTVSDAVGVAVNASGLPLLHRPSMAYPAEALAKGIQGTVVAELKLDARGEVSDAVILSGPEALRRNVLQSVLTWHFDSSVASTARTVSIDFAKPANAADPAVHPAPTAAFAPANGPASRPATPRLVRILVSGLSQQAQAALLARLPVHERSAWYPGLLASVEKAAKDFDSHLKTTVFLNRGNQQEVALLIGPEAEGVPPQPAQALNTPASPLPAGVYSVGNGVLQPMLISKVDPQYSEEARKATFNGTMTLSVVVDTDGKAENVQVVRSLGMGLDEKAIEAVRQWVFRPGTYQGAPVPVRAMLEVNFRLL